MGWKRGVSKEEPGVHEFRNMVGRNMEGSVSGRHKGIAAGGFTVGSIFGLEGGFHGSFAFTFWIPDAFCAMRCGIGEAAGSGC